MSKNSKIILVSLLILMILATNISYTEPASEFLVNTNTVNNHGPHVATDGNGNFLITWRSWDETGVKTYGRWFDKNGSSQGDEFLIDNFSMSSIGMRSDGRFIITWYMEKPEGTSMTSGRIPLLPHLPKHTDIFVRIYNEDGTPNGVEMKVNTSDGFHWWPDVAVHPTGSFVIAWYSIEEKAIYARMYDEEGIPKGGDFRVDTIQSVQKNAPRIAIDRDGNFVITWVAGWGNATIYARRYDPSGIPQGPEFQVNTSSPVYPDAAAIAMDGEGNFIIVWASSSIYYVSPGNIYGQRYDRLGNAIGSEIRVKTTILSSLLPTVGMDHDGNFAVAWQSYCKESDGPCYVFLRRFSFNGFPLEKDFITNSISGSWVGSPSIGMNDNGKFMLAWENESSPFLADIYANFYNIPKSDLIGSWDFIEKNFFAKTTFLVKGSFKIQNIGDTVSGNTTVTFYLSDDQTLDEEDNQIKKVRIGKLEPENSRRIPLNFRVKHDPSGNAIIAVIDEEDSIIESNELNNSSFQIIP